ncbi:MATE family efflux transporter [uncultured Eubacterium sp.]|uniref:MATE family efflux transporter n=1 Tax=uncultured Eubacterium sp. TaxID=165185 RepID=UPI00267142DE|nr:MATE family efflux transporter [uncultured Eubacterium sp.]
MTKTYEERTETENPLGTQPVGKLLRKFAVPSIISMLVMSLYNIVDQIFIGQTVGELGNAATNVAFPLTTLCIATALAFGIGGASGFNLNLGAGEKEKAPYFIGNSAIMMAIIGVILAVISSVAMKPLLLFFGSTESILPYAMEYTKYIAIGFPFAIVSAGGSHLVRADGSPKFSMACNLVGAFVNVILDYLFVMVFGWEMMGAAIATIIGQFLACLMVIWYLLHFKTIKLKKQHFIPQIKVIARAAHLGMAQCLNQLAIMFVQVVMNKSLTYYGALSSYGADIPLACTGIVMKVNQVYFSVCIGVAQGIQPIASFNRGAGKFDRVKKTYKLAVICNTTVSVIAFIVFQLFPRQIISIFGSGSAEYFQFAENFFRIFLFMTFLNGIQPITSTFCTVIGEPNKGTFLSLTRQVICFIPLMVVFPLVFQKLGFLGIDGILYVAPVSDFLAAVLSLIVIRGVFKKLK